jgi:hypothetical protein
MKRWVPNITIGGRHELVLEKTKVIQRKMEATIKTGQEKMKAEPKVDQEKIKVGY